MNEAADSSTASALPRRGERLLFVTGRLAEDMVRRIVRDLAANLHIDADVHVLGISVAALMHVDWVRRKLQVEPGRYDRIVVPGWCQGPIEELTQLYQTPVERGPKHVSDLPEHFGRAGRSPPDLSRYDVEIIAEINHAPQLATADILRMAARYREEGADLIDVGCIPGASWNGVADVVRALRDAGHRVSIDSFDRREVEAAVAAGAELVLSCNASNRDWAADLAAELVVIPDDPHLPETMDPTIELLEQRGRRFRLDSILEPVGFGFAASLLRYFDARRRYPEAPMMMGIGNATEMSEVDSSGVNFLLAAICQELSIHSVLTTAVAPWCRTAVKEFDLARRLVRHAHARREIVKRLDSSLLMLRDRKVHELSPDTLRQLASHLTDPNVRVFVAGEALHVMNRNGHWQGTDPFLLFDHLLAATPTIDPAHAFYLGYELAKATTALTLGKQYTQDQPLDWGFLTRPEVSVHDRKKS